MSDPHLKTLKTDNKEENLENCLDKYIMGKFAKRSEGK